jgi:molybdate-binding protein/DNA-binding XRE family transcriptional regulator
MTSVSNAVRGRRAAAGLRQEDLAARVGLSRQSLSGIEAGRRVPSTEVALRLAHELRCRVEELFWTNDQRSSLTVELANDEVTGTDASPRESRRGLARPSRQASSAGVRAVLGSIGGRWVAHRLSAADAGAYQTTADVLLPTEARPAKQRTTAAAVTARARPLSDWHRARSTLLCAGCAPAMGILSARTSAEHTDRVVWLDRSSRTALGLLARGQVHVAGAHLFDDARGEFNEPFVRSQFPDRAMLLFTLARWESGFAVTPGNPRRIRDVRDLGRPDVTFVGRQPGAAAQELIDRLLRQAGLPATAPRARATARGHQEVARLVALGVGDAGVTLRAMASAQGLDFVPLAEERFDIIVEKSSAADPRIARLLETVCGQAFRRELAALGGHLTRDAGKLIADTSQPQ